MPKIRVAIVEDNKEFRHGLCATLNFTTDFECVCACSTLNEALRVIPTLKPDVVLMDINLGSHSGIDCVAEIKQKLPELNIIMLTISDDADSVFRSLQAGASGYLVKDTPPGKMFDAITEIHAGGSPMSSRIARLLVRKFQQKEETSSNAKTKTNLTERELEIVELLAKGYRDKEIAGELKIAISTVLSHVRNIYTKLQVRSRAEAVARVGASGNA